ncbi:MAG: hypothetical protein QM752_00875 [Gammaproteobacteria bacterium]
MSEDRKKFGTAVYHKMEALANNDYMRIVTLENFKKFIPDSHRLKELENLSNYTRSEADAKLLEGQEYDNVCLSQAIKFSRLDLVQYLVNECDADLTLCDYNFRDPIRLAIDQIDIKREEGQDDQNAVNILKFLLSKLKTEHLEHLIIGEVNDEPKEPFQFRINRLYHEVVKKGQDDIADMLFRWVSPEINYTKNKRQDDDALHSFRPKLLKDPRKKSESKPSLLSTSPSTFLGRSRSRSPTRGDDEPTSKRERSRSPARGYVCGVSKQNKH